MHHIARQMLKRAFAIGQEIIDAGGNGYVFTVTLTSGRRVVSAFEHLDERCDYIESMNPEKPALIHLGAIAMVEVQEV